MGNLPSLQLEGVVSFEKALVTRWAVRCLRGDLLAQKQLAQLLWVTSGVNPRAGGYERSTGTHGERGIWYVYIDAGHAAQNLLLQTTAMGLGTGLVGTFHDEDVSRVLENISLASTSVGFAGRIPE